ncbi:hypothetical protein ACHAW6_002842 [Cyclotella cf. meneghiniana]
MCLATPTNDVKSSSENRCRKTIANTAEADTTDISEPTFPVETAPQQMDVTSLTSAELSELKINDPFMYYSIPFVRNAALHGKDVSVLDVPSRSTSIDNECPKRSVTRQRRISTEFHPDVLLEEIFADQEFMSSLNELKSDVSALLDGSHDAYEGSLFEYLL